MSQPEIELIIRRFDSPDETRVMEKGKFEVVQIGGLTIGRATYEPGWRWSEHVGPTIGAKRCTVAHVGLVLSGTATAALEDGLNIQIRAARDCGSMLKPLDTCLGLSILEKTLEVTCCKFFHDRRFASLNHARTRSEASP